MTQATPRLSIELVPPPNWYWNLRSLLSQAEWNTLRQATFQASGRVCDICGGQGRRWSVECHEIWSYDEHALIQSLDGLTSLCPNCHLVKHYGLARVQGREAQALAWLRRVNGWSQAQAQAHIQEAFATMQRRSVPGWRLDLTWLRDHWPQIAANHRPAP